MGSKRRGAEVRGIRSGAVLLVVGVLINLSASAQVLPFFTDTSLTVGFESNAFRTFSRFVARNGFELNGKEVPDPADRDVFVFAQVFAVPMRLGPGTVLTVAAPVLHKESNFNSSGSSRNQLADSGLGDMTLSLKQRFYHNDFLGGGVQAAFIGGVKLPSGDRNQRDPEGNLLPPGLQLGTGSTDFPLGLVFTAFKDRVGFNAALAHRFNNQWKGSRFGDETKVDLAFGYRLFPAEFKSFHDKVLSVYLEVNTAISQRARVDEVEVPDSGGSIGFLTPGIQAVLSPRFLIEAAFQIPVYQRLNGTQLAFTATANLGIRLLF